MRIVFLLDASEVPPENPDFGGRWNSKSPSMEHHVIQAARRSGHTTLVVPFGEDLHATLCAIEQSRPHVVFNLVEYCYGNHRLSAQVPALLETLAIPFTGCSAVGLTLSSDKALSARLVADRGIPVPGFAVLPVGRTRLPLPLRYPLIVKPRFGDGSDGISLRSIVRNQTELARRASLVHRRLQQDALCQEYIDGREIAVGILGNRRLRALPARETVFGMRHAGGPPIATERVKESKAYSEKWKIDYRRAELTTAQAATAASFAKAAYECLELGGYGRVDFRMDGAGRLFFLEANGNPDIRPRVFGVMAAWAGIEYVDLIQLIIELAL